MHTHSQVDLQSGAEITAIAKPGKKKDTTGSAARNNIWCPAVLQVVEIGPLRKKRWRSKVSIASGWLIDVRFAKYLKGRALASN
jgi:hypothetical protein